MKKKISLVLLTIFVCSVGMGHEEDTPTTSKHPQTTTETGKKTRKKKVEMCSECGKPEPQCECHGHDKKEEKK